MAQVDFALGELAVALRVMAVGDAHADIEHAVAAREDPAVARAQRAVPDDLELVDAADHRVVLHIAAQCHAARRLPLRHARREQRLRHRAGGEQHQRRAQIVRRLAGLQLRADDAALVFDGRAEAHRREHPRTGCHRGAAEDQVECLARQHRQGAGHVDAPAARADAADMARRLRLREHGIEHAQFAQRVVRVGDQSIAANLVARKAVLIDEHHVETGARERDRRRTAGRAGADDQHVAARRQRVRVGVQAVGSV